jgi:hypothetical protein
MTFPSLDESSVIFAMPCFRMIQVFSISQRMMSMLIQALETQAKKAAERAWFIILTPI